MSAASTPSTYGRRDPSTWVKGIVVVVALHVLVGYAMVSGMARKGLDLVKKPLEAVLIQEVIIPPPPPPPPPKKVEPPKELPKVQAPPPPFVPPPDVAPAVVSPAPVIVASPTPPPAPAVIAPPPPPAPPAPAAVAPAPPPVVAGPKRASIGVACPTQLAPEMPRRALQDGIEGVVKAQILIKNGVVQEVTIVSGPSVFHAAVKKAIAQYKCVADGPEVLATQEFSFKFD
jgi:protein TonB